MARVCLVYPEDWGEEQCGLTISPVRSGQYRQPGPGRLAGRAGTMCVAVHDGLLSGEQESTQSGSSSYRQQGK